MPGGRPRKELESLSSQISVRLTPTEAIALDRLASEGESRSTTLRRLLHRIIREDMPEFWSEQDTIKLDEHALERLTGYLEGEREQEEE